MPPFTSVQDYIAAQPEDARARLRELQAIVRSVVPEATESISYGMPTYRFAAGAVHFGAAKRHCALYGSAFHRFADELRDFDTSKGTVRFPLDRPIPEELVRKLVAATVAERESARKP